MQHQVGVFMRRRLLPLLLLLLLCHLQPATSQSEHIQYAIRNGAEKCVGVNLGGWLVVEYNMTQNSNLWKDVPATIRTKGEYYTMMFLGHEKGDLRFMQHRDSWITENDIAEMAQYGLNCVRVPVGYWITQDPTDHQASVFAPQALKYLDLLINNWANKYNLAVLVSLHAHKGSQNGKESSAPINFGAKQWSSSTDNVKNSIKWATFLADRYRNSSAFLGLGLLNEPDYPTNPVVVKDYYTKVYTTIRLLGNDCVLVVSPMATEQASPYMMEFMTNMRNVWIEWHPYWRAKAISTDTTDASDSGACDEAEEADQLLVDVVTYGQVVIKSWKGVPLLLSEWSMAVLDAPPNSVFEDESQYQRFGLAQLQSFRHAQAGWMFWSWRHADDARAQCSGWSMRSLLEAQILYF